MSDVVSVVNRTPAVGKCVLGKAFRIGTVRYNWPMSAHASQALSIVHCTNSEDLPTTVVLYCHSMGFWLGIGIELE